MELVLFGYQWERLFPAMWRNLSKNQYSYRKGLHVTPLTNLLSIQPSVLLGSLISPYIQITHWMMVKDLFTGFHTYIRLYLKSHTWKPFTHSVMDILDLWCLFSPTDYLCGLLILLCLLDLHLDLLSFMFCLLGFWEPFTSSDHERDLCRYHSYLCSGDRKSRTGCFIGQKPN